jgi:hypothetical protein
MQISYRYQSADLEIDDWRMWRHEWFSLVIALKICIISRSGKRAIKGVFIPLYVSLITWKGKSNYFYSILEVFHKVLWKIKNRVMCPLRDRPFNLHGFLFRSEIFFCRIKREFFFQNLTLGYMTKTQNQIIFFPPIKSEYIFQQHWESEYFFRTPPSLEVKWSVPKSYIMIQIRIL